MSCRAMIASMSTSGCSSHRWRRRRPPSDQHAADTTPAPHGGRRLAVPPHAVTPPFVHHRHIDCVASRGVGAVVRARARERARTVDGARAVRVPRRGEQVQRADLRGAACQRKHAGAAAAREVTRRTADASRRTCAEMLRPPPTLSSQRPRRCRSSSRSSPARGNAPASHHVHGPEL